MVVMMLVSISYIVIESLFVRVFFFELASEPGACPSQGIAPTSTHSKPFFTERYLKKTSAPSLLPSASTRCGYFTHCIHGSLFTCSISDYATVDQSSIIERIRLPTSQSEKCSCLCNQNPAETQLPCQPRQSDIQSSFVSDIIIIND